MCAVSTNLPETQKFGIDDERVFGFWDWVGGRYSVCSAIGMLPLSLHFGFTYMVDFLRGANKMDQHFLHTKDIRKNIPLLLGLITWHRNSIQVRGFFIVFSPGSPNYRPPALCPGLTAVPSPHPISLYGIQRQNLASISREEGPIHGA